MQTGLQQDKAVFFVAVLPDEGDAGPGLCQLLPMSSSTVTVFVQGAAGVHALPSFVPQSLMTLCSSCPKKRLSSLLPLCMLVFVFLFQKYLHMNPVSL